MRSGVILLMMSLGILLLPQGAAAAPPSARTCDAMLPCLADADCPVLGGQVTYKCVDDPGDDCESPNGPPDCPGICAMPIPDFCGGFPLWPCPPGTTCIETATQLCAYDCGGRDCGGECVLWGDRPSKCHGKNRTKCSKGLTCLDNMFDACHDSCGGIRCEGLCGSVAPDSCTIGDPGGCPEGTLCVHFTDFSPYGTPPGGKTSCGLLPDLGCQIDFDCPPGMVCADNPNDNCDPLKSRKPCPSCCVPRE